jgi:hypothetical protein
LTEVSVFKGIVRSENSYTQLLYNLLMRDEHFRRDVLSLFVGEAQTELFEGANIQIQKCLPNRGQPDLLIEGPALSLIVEVKTENLCVRTVKQSVSGPEDDPKSYLAYLKSQEGKGKKSVLVFLVPPDWKYRPDVGEEIAEYTREGREKGVDVKQITWQQLVDRHGDTVGSVSLSQEFINLIKDRFGPVIFTEGEISSMETGEMSLETLLKINKLIDDVRKKAGRPATDKLEVAVDEVGFYLRKGRKGVLFFGCWLPVWKEHGHVLCFGVDDNSMKAAFSKALKEVYKQEVIDYGGYHVGYVPEEDMRAKEPETAHVIWENIKKIWSELEGAAES